MVGFDSLPTYSNKKERGINMANMKVKILVMENWVKHKNGMV